jgi:hypothetical protein
VELSAARDVTVPCMRSAVSAPHSATAHRAVLVDIQAYFGLPARHFAAGHDELVRSACHCTPRCGGGLVGVQVAASTGELGTDHRLGSPPLRHVWDTECRRRDGCWLLDRVAWSHGAMVDLTAGLADSCRGALSRSAAWGRRSGEAGVRCRRWVLCRFAGLMTFVFGGLPMMRGCAAGRLVA